ncbi:hypothetical protein DEI81_07815 [Curtobacterium sp. MCBD17_013]|uniref:Lrp/AsnC family transcriptional regulator n=1 Tax=unclassified Curtobacterium TaxID=257496 RepID=UPI000DA906EA|nr:MULTISPECIES: Lrp/AsnC family transcriptional regulator [unclassified Curtobacterium]PZF63307.1 hypothetical protein DEI81_07815 [Curtobacterium sp. MCBD17_013]WIB64269.1 Lrp/AsnC family transcriptional regulator [Curtobacterium sp. MCBD17_040]
MTSSSDRGSVRPPAAGDVDGTPADGNAGTPDPIDLALLTALAADGRASWAALGEASGCSASTAQRRVGRLNVLGFVRIIAATDVLAAGFGVSAMVRMRCGASRTTDLVARLQSRPEVRFLATLTGTADCVAELVVERIADIGPLLADIAPDGDVETEALPVLRTFTAPFTVFPGKSLPMPLSATANAPAPDLGADDGVLPTEVAATPLERAMVGALVRDGRTPLNDLARHLDRTETATRRALEQLIASGRVRVGPLVAPALLGLGTELMVWISVAPDLLGAAARQLAQHPAVHYAAATLGRYNLIGQAFLRDFAAVYTFATDVLGALPGVREVDVTVQLTTRKRMWRRIEDGRFVDADDAQAPVLT